MKQPYGTKREEGTHHTRHIHIVHPRTRQEARVVVMPVRTHLDNVCGVQVGQAVPPVARLERKHAIHIWQREIHPVHALGIRRHREAQVIIQHLHLKLHVIGGVGRPGAGGGVQLLDAEAVGHFILYSVNAVLLARLGCAVVVRGWMDSQNSRFLGSPCDDLVHHTRVSEKMKGKSERQYVKDNET